MKSESFFDGEWWLPDNPVKRLPGRLTYSSEEGTELILLGKFDNDDSPFSNRGVEERSIILGVAFDCGAVTLVKATRAGSTHTGGGLSKVTYHTSTAFLGKHFEKLEDIRFRNFEVHYSHLNDWARLVVFKHQVQPGQPETLAWQREKPISTYSGSDLKISLCGSIASRIKATAFVDLKQTTLLLFEHQIPLTFDEFRVRLRDVQNFLTLGVSEAVNVLSVSARVSDEEDLAEVKIMHQFGAASGKENIDFFRMLFTFESIKSSPESYLKRWLDSAENLRAVHNLAFGSLYNPHIYLEGSFLNSVQALEAYHRRTTTLLDSPADEDADRRSAILSAVPSQFKEWLSKKLDFSNELSLRKRLSLLIDRHPSIKRLLIAADKDFVQHVVDARNRLTHYSEKSRDELNWRDLWILSEKLRILFVACMLEDIGFEKAQVESMVEEHHFYGAILRQN